MAARTKLDRMTGGIRGAKLTAAERVVWITLMGYADADGHNAWPAVDTLAWATQMGVRTVQRAIKTLTAKGVIVETAPATNRRPATYSVLDPECATKPESPRVAPDEESRGANLTPQGCQSDTSRGANLTPDPVLDPVHDPVLCDTSDSDESLHGVLPRNKLRADGQADKPTGSSSAGTATSAEEQKRSNGSGGETPGDRSDPISPAFHRSDDRRHLTGWVQYIAATRAQDRPDLTEDALEKFASDLSIVFGVDDEGYIYGCDYGWEDIPKKCATDRYAAGKWFNTFLNSWQADDGPLTWRGEHTTSTSSRRAAS